MNPSKQFGICIVILLAATVVHAMTLDQLLSGYDSSYNDGGFTVSLTGTGRTPVANEFAGRTYFNFTIGGSASSSQYTVVANMDPGVQNYKQSIIANKTMNSAGIAKLTFDGSYYFCGTRANYANNFTVYDNTFRIDLRIYQNGILKYQKLFLKNAPCSSNPVNLGVSTSPKIYFFNSNSRLITLLKLLLPEQNRVYKVGVYITDNKSTTAYLGERYINRSYPFNSVFGAVSLAFPINLTLSEVKVLQGFNLTNEKLFIKAITVDGQTINLNVAVNQEGIQNAVNVTNYNSFNTNRFYTSNFSKNYFTTNTVFVANPSSGKIKQLGATISASNYNGKYNISASLENIYGETIEIKNITTSTWPITIWFNGTYIYNSKINGPYRIGFLRITQNNNEVIDKLDAATSKDLAYTNFTSPVLPDLKIDNSDMKGNGKDINITVHNIGQGDSAGITMSLFDSTSNQIKEIIIDSLRAGKSTNYSFRNINLTYGAFAILDFNNLIEESNESNNMAQLNGPGIDPAKIISKQPNQNSLTMNSPKQFNVTASGTLPISFNWYINNGSLFRIVSNTNSFLFNPGYYDEGIRTIKANVQNANGSQETSWKINVTPKNIAVYAYVYNQNEKVNSNLNVAINSNVSFNGINKKSTSTIPAKINLTVDSVQNVTYTSYNFKPFATKFFFDRRLFTCIENQNCNFNNVYNTNCVWDASSWACTVTDGVTTDYFRMYTNPKRIKINAYLAVNST